MDSPEAILHADDRLLLLVPHPDDETLAAGGLLQQAAAVGADICVILVSDGENNPWVQRIAERRLHIGPRQRSRFGERRWNEFREAMACLVGPAYDLLRLAIPDQGVTPLLMTEADGLINRLHEQFVLHRPSVVVIPSVRDRHPDHNALAVAARMALRRLPLELRPRMVMSFLIHATTSTPVGLPMLIASLTPSQRRCKWEAICRHTSQMSCHRRHFRRIAYRDEMFLVGESAISDMVDHPVRARIEEKQFCLSILCGRWSFGAHRADIWILAVIEKTPIACFKVVVKGRQSHPLIQRWSNGDVIGHASRHRRNGEVTINVDRQLLGDPDRVFIKFNRRPFFFDVAGWLEVAIPAN